MGRSSLKYDLKKEALKGLSNDTTVRSYKAGCDQFAQFCKEQGIKRFDAVDKETIQTYEAHMEDRGMSPATIHSRLAPVCRATKISMKEIDKPARTSDQTTRSRTSWKNEQGISQRENPAYDRVVKGQEAIGCRRSELGRLRIDNCLRFDKDGKAVDWVRDESGHICVEIIKGKGGKTTLQRIAPDKLDQLREVIRSCKSHDPKTRLFSREEMSNKLDLHGIRAEVARNAYDRYAARLQNDPAYKDQLRSELIARYDRFNDPARRGAERHRERFVRDITNEKPYLLRGSNREIALANGRPTELDRLAIMATSVFYLSHWRADVTVTSYLLGR